jgi:putative colanic acid biosynthesis acetyltransferase WcaF
MEKITLKAYAIVSQGAHLCTGTHDVSDPDFRLFARPIVIGERAWVTASAFVGPGVTIGDGAILGARAVTFSDVAPWWIFVGNPARLLKKRVIRDIAR